MQELYYSCYLNLVVTEKGLFPLFEKPVFLNEHLQQIQKKDPEKFQQICKSKESFTSFIQQFNPDFECKQANDARLTH